MTSLNAHPDLRRYQSNEASVTLTGGRALAEMLKLHEVGPMTGMGGFQLLPFYDSIRPAGLTHHLINDERTAIFAAVSYAMVSGRPGVCDATLGPGATNLTTGLVEARNAGIPLVVLTGNSNRDYTGKHMTQEGNQTAILQPATKQLLRIETPKRIPELVRRAFALATSGRPGPVVLDVPEDIAHAEVELAVADLYADPACLSVPARRCVPAPNELAAAADLLVRAERPLILAGGGVHLSGGQEALQAFAEAESIPVAHTISGKGTIACTHPLSAGLFGRYSRIGNDLIADSDLLLVIGCKLGEIPTKRYQLIPQETPLIHLDSDADEFGHTAQPRLALWGDARESLRALQRELADGAPTRRQKRQDYAAEVERRNAAWREETAERRQSEAEPVHVARLVQEISDALPENGILVADGGFAAHWTSLIHMTKRAGRDYVADRGFASIGYGVPGALGAWLADPGRPIVGLTGDGGLNMALGDLETLCRVGAEVTIVVVNNAASGYVKALQHHMYAGQYQSSDLTDLDYARVAEAMGCRSVRVERPNQLAQALSAALAERGRPAVVDVVVTRDPGAMLPAVDSRVQQIKRGDRPV